MRARSVVRIQSASADLAGLDLEQALLVGAERLARRRRRRAARTPAWARPTLPRLAAQYSSWSARFQPATPPPNSVAAYEISTGHAVLLDERVGVVGRQRRGARDDRPHAREVVAGRGPPRSTMRSAAGTRLTRCGDGARRTASAHSSTVEPLEQDERPAVVDALQHPEQPAEVHQRRVHDHDAAAQPRSASRLLS